MEVEKPRGDYSRIKSHEELSTFISEGHSGPTAKICIRFCKIGVNAAKEKSLQLLQLFHKPMYEELVLGDQYVAISCGDTQHVTIAHRFELETIRLKKQEMVEFVRALPDIEAHIHAI